MDRWRMTGGEPRAITPAAVHQGLNSDWHPLRASVGFCGKLFDLYSTCVTSPMDTSGRSHDAWDTCTYALLTTANSHANVDILRPGFPVRKQRDDRRVVEAILARIVDFAIGDSLTFVNLAPVTLFESNCAPGLNHHPSPTPLPVPGPHDARRQTNTPLQSTGRVSSMPHILLSGGSKPEVDLRALPLQSLTSNAEHLASSQTN
ncbi:hypothetical protein FA13DRAFT_1709665, partial [Coprinellus micaceus]